MFNLWKDPKLLGDPHYEHPKVLWRVEGGASGHEINWARAIKECKENRTPPPSSNFEYTDPFNETVVMGKFAVRLQELNRVLQ